MSETSRKQIRHAIVTLLTNKTSCGARVFPSRVRNVFGLELPCILVYSLAEEVTVFTAAPVEYKRDLGIRIEILAKADDLLDDTLDDIAEDVEYWMHQDFTQGELCGDTILKSLNQNIQIEGETLIGSLALNYELPYYTEAVTDESELDTLALANVKIHMADDAASGQIDSEDLINVTGAGI